MFIKFLSSNIYLLVLFSMGISFLVANRVMRPLIWTLRQRNLLDEPEDRSAHGTTTATMGGVGIYIAFSFTLVLFTAIVGLENKELITILTLFGAGKILLFLGVKDDLAAVTPRKKLMGQVVAAAIMVLLADVRIYSFEGLFGIGELPYMISLVFSVFVFVALINAFNLIDGVDGLAGFIALLASVTFGIFFFVNENVMHLMVSGILIGAIIGFLRYNFSKEWKIFMGDTGSMVVGFLLGFQALAFLELNALETTSFPVSNGPVMALAILAYPILDTLRVFVIRIRDGRSPFSADRNHIHHRCLGLGLNHMKTSLLLVILNAFIVGMAFLTNELYINVHGFMLLVAVPLAFELPFLRQWLPNALGAKNKAEAPQIGNEPKVIPMADLHRTPNTYLGSTPHMYSEYIYQLPENQVTDSLKARDGQESVDTQKIATKRVVTLRRVQDQHNPKENSRINQ